MGVQEPARFLLGPAQAQAAPPPPHAPRCLIRTLAIFAIAIDRATALTLTQAKVHPSHQCTYATLSSSVAVSSAMIMRTQYLRNVLM